MKSRLSLYQIASQPVPILLVEIERGFSSRKKKADELQDYCWEKWPVTISSLARGVSFDRFPVILKNGCDVEPTNSPIYAEMSLDKVIEYGCEGDQIVQFFRRDHLDRTYREVPVTITPNELALLQETYPTKLTSEDCEFHWLSRLTKEDRRISSPYERSFGWWIPGDPIEALILIIIIGDDVDSLLQKTREAIRGSQNSEWKLLDDL